MQQARKLQIWVEIFIGSCIAAKLCPALFIMSISREDIVDTPCAVYRSFILIFPLLLTKSANSWWAPVWSLKCLWSLRKSWKQRRAERWTGIVSGICVWKWVKPFFCCLAWIGRWRQMWERPRVHLHPRSTVSKRCGTLSQPNLAQSQLQFIEEGKYTLLILFSYTGQFFNYKSQNLPIQFSFHQPSKSFSVKEYK